MPASPWTWPPGEKVHGFSTWWLTIGRTDRSPPVHITSDCSLQLACSCRVSALGSQGVETHFIHFANRVLRLKSWSDSGCPSGWIQIVWVELMTFHPLGLPFPVPHCLPFLLLRRICGAHVAVLTGSSTFELPSSRTPTFSGLIPVILTTSHSNLAAWILLKGLNCINSHILVLFVQRGKKMKRNSLASRKSGWDVGSSNTCRAHIPSPFRCVWTRLLSTHLGHFPKVGIPFPEAAVVEGSSRSEELLPCEVMNLVKWSENCSVMSDSATPQTIQSMEFSRPEYWSGLAFPFSRRSSQPRDCLPHCRRILYQLSHQGSPRILEWVAYPLSRGSSLPRNQTGVSCIAGGFFTNWAIREARHLVSLPVTVFLMIDVLTAPMCFRGAVCLLAVCPYHESEGKWQKQECECLETNKVAGFFSDTFWFWVQDFQSKYRMPPFCKWPLVWLLHGLVLLVQKATPGLDVLTH